MNLSMLFEAPSKQFRPIPFWFWNETRQEKFNKKTICDQIKQFHLKGLGGFVIFNKPAYNEVENFGFTPNEYLGDKWFDSCRIAIEQANEFGMEVWINDDYDFPPGGLAGKMKHLFPQAHPLSLNYKLTTTLDDYPNKNTLSIIANPKGNNIFQNTLLLFCANTPDAHKICNLSGEYEYIITSAERVNGDEEHLNRFPCFLDPDVNDIFIAEAYEKYKLNLGDLFGNGLTGFFADCDARRAHHFPWARKFDERFTETNGYSIAKFLPAIWLNFGETSQQVRHDYFAFISMLYSNWFKKCYEWCHANGIKYMYHTSDTGPFSITESSAAYCRRSSYFVEGKFHQVNAYADYIGTDHELLALNGGLHFDPKFNGTHEDWEPQQILCGGTRDRLDFKRSTLPNKTYGDLRAKYASSLAHCRGKRGAMCEAFAATNWSAAIEDLKWIADWQIVQGINRFVPHALFFSIEGKRKHFAPPDHFHSPLWENYHIFSAYVGRLCGLLSMGTHVADIAVLDVAASLWSSPGYDPLPFFNLTDILNHSCFDYDIISEEDIINAMVTPQGLKIANETYKAVILPAPTKLNTNLTQKLNDFSCSNGQIVSFYAMPNLNKVTQIDLENFDNNSIATEHSVLKVLENMLIPDACFFDSVNRKKAGYVHFLHRKTDQQDIYFITNLEGHDKSEHLLTMSIPATNSPIMLWDPTTEKKCSLISNPNNRRTEINLSLPYRSSQLVVIDHAASNSLIPYHPLLNATAKELREWTIKPLDMNILPMTIWSSEKLGQTTTLGQPLPENDSLSFRFELLSSVKDLVMLIPEFIDLSKIEINEKRLANYNNKANRLVFDANYHTINIASFVSPGPNTIKLCINNSENQKLEYTAFYLEGSFSVNVANCGTKTFPYKSWYHFKNERFENAIIKLDKPSNVSIGDWCEQGLPFYSGSMRYSTQFEINEQNMEKAIYLNINLMNCTAQIRCNGQFCDTICWQPYNIKLNGKIQLGNNTLQIDVRNTWANIMEEYPLKSGLSHATLLECNS